jgi:hypothetical protein
MTWLLIIIMVGAQGDVAVTSQMVSEQQCRAVVATVAGSTGPSPLRAMCISPTGETIK